MRIVFITNTDRHSVSYFTMSQKTLKEQLDMCIYSSDVVQLDYETTGLDAINDKLLLCSINVNGVVFVIDCTTVNIASLLGSKLKNKLVVAHNAKFEYKFSKTNGVTLDKMYCTMLVDQRLTMGVDTPSDLVSVCKKMGIELPEGMDKDIRNTFIGADPNTIVFTDEQILYSAGDVMPLLKIREGQAEYITRYNMEHLIRNIEMPLINVLGDTELYGWRFNSDQWIDYAKSKELEAKDIVKELDEYIVSKGVDVNKINPDLIRLNEGREKKVERLETRLSKLADKIRDFEDKGKIHLKAYKVTLETWEKCCEEMDELVTTPYEEKYLGINWSSSDQVIKVFQELGMPLPMDKDKSTKQLKPSIGKEARSLWFSDHEGTEWNEVFSKFDRYKKLIHNVNAFGEEWVNKYVRDGRVYTYFWQCNTDTGRLACGDAKSGYPNIQQIPAVKELRACFIADEGKELVTCDLAAAELRIMCSLAGDDVLWSLGESGDIHSPIATNAWRAVYRSRGDKELSESFLITKDINSDMRRKFKNLTFGSIYGCHSTKAATTVGVAKHEGQIILDGIKSTIPKTFHMVESAVKEAFSQGYLVSDTRSYSRKWFPAILQGRELEFMEKVGIEGQSRNFKIQSSQASMVKECLVYIDKFNRDNILDVQLLGCVHDETIYQYPIGLEVTYNGEVIPYAEFVSRAMIDVCNLYLNAPYLMETDYHVAEYWLK